MFWLVCSNLEIVRKVYKARNLKQIMEFKEILEMLRDSCLETDLRPDDNIILDCSTRIFISQNIENNKSKKDTSLATEKQIALLKKMRINIPEGLTKKGASDLIKQKLPEK